MNLPKAFDTVDRNNLIVGLEAYGFSLLSLKHFKSYLDN